MNILKQIYPAIAITVVLTVLLGIVYPLVVTGLAQVIVRTLVRGHTQSRQFGFLGEPRVNVLELNLALGEMRHR